LIDATVVKVDAANDLALLKAVGRFAPLPIAASRTAKLGGTVATMGFPDIGLQGFAPGKVTGDEWRAFPSLVTRHSSHLRRRRRWRPPGRCRSPCGRPPSELRGKSSLLLSFLESVPDVDAKLKEPNTKDEAFEEVVKSAQDAAVLVLVY
jgi:hypothetical protein